ncbi:hypothetical protein PtA15_13A135 [Puccinia triticina]|uniref:Uncharacterized protein n=1 Tax=Puccinia triticina TaxID=208348 RepID=A0ABY7CZW9_9BASI|nr:uncharacterized protein PtA15_13A135 [Puccinia triticina]WAQ90736.1 hypothetical protein PtA15_13A135 [Puccinia triticina]WAR60923.1 hypothetical protein PtB15_13B174 [Puccinia triticina]
MLRSLINALAPLYPFTASFFLLLLHGLSSGLGSEECLSNMGEVDWIQDSDGQVYQQAWSPMSNTWVGTPKGNQRLLFKTSSFCDSYLDPQELWRASDDNDTGPKDWNMADGSVRSGYIENMHDHYQPKSYKSNLQDATVEQVRKRKVYTDTSDLSVFG